MWGEGACYHMGDLVGPEAGLEVRTSFSHKERGWRSIEIFQRGLLTEQQSRCEWENTEALTEKMFDERELWGSLWLWVYSLIQLVEYLQTRLTTITLLNLQSLVTTSGHSHPHQSTGRVPGRWGQSVQLNVKSPAQSSEFSLSSVVGYLVSSCYYID